MPARPGDRAKTTAPAAGRVAALRPASASPRASAPRLWRQYWQIIPLAVVLWTLDAVDKFRAGAQAAGLLHARVINDLSGRLSTGAGQPRRLAPARPLTVLVRGPALPGPAPRPRAARRLRIPIPADPRSTS